MHYKYLNNNIRTFVKFYALSARPVPRIFILAPPRCKKLRPAYPWFACSRLWMDFSLLQVWDKVWGRTTRVSNGQWWGQLKFHMFRMGMHCAFWFGFWVNLRISVQKKSAHPTLLEPVQWCWLLVHYNSATNSLIGANPDVSRRPFLPLPPP